MKSKYNVYLKRKFNNGQISGRFYKFLTRNFPNYFTTEVRIMVKNVLGRSVHESTAISLLKQRLKKEIKKQKNEDNT
jgi:hypothetical protein